MIWNQRKKRWRRQKGSDSFYKKYKTNVQRAVEASAKLWSWRRLSPNGRWNWTLPSSNRRIWRCWVVTLKWISIKPLLGLKGSSVWTSHCEGFCWHFQLIHSGGSGGRLGDHIREPGDPKLKARSQCPDVISCFPIFQTEQFIGNDTSSNTVRSFTKRYTLPSGA